MIGYCKTVEYSSSVKHINMDSRLKQLGSTQSFSTEVTHLKGNNFLKLFTVHSVTHRVIHNLFLTQALVKQQHVVHEGVIITISHYTIQDNLQIELLPVHQNKFKN
jgi:hypothetical protein